MKIKKYLTVIVLCGLSSFLVAQPHSLLYRGDGILKVKQGDTVQILPEKAYVVNQHFFDAAGRSMRYVETNKSDSVIVLLKDKVEFLEHKIRAVSYDYEKALHENKSNIQEMRILNSELRRVTIKQQQSIEAVETELEKRKANIESLEKQIVEKDIQNAKKLRRRTVILTAPIALLLAKLGADIFF